MSETLRIFAVRGAVCCANSPPSIEEAVVALYREILSKNAIDEADIVSIQFTVTADLTAENPATALRKAGAARDVPLFVSAEPQVEGGLPRTIRIMISFYGNKKPVSVYMNGAEALRPDLFL